MYQVIDTTNDNAVISEHLTWRKALNATRRLEPKPSIKRPGTNWLGEPSTDWRYLVRKA